MDHALVNDHDRANVEFICSLDTSTRMDWWNSITEDDKLYATEIVEEYNRMINATILMTSDNVEDSMVESNLVLSKFMNKE